MSLLKQFESEQGNDCLAFGKRSLQGHSYKFVWRRFGPKLTFNIAPCVYKCSIAFINGSDLLVSEEVVEHDEFVHIVGAIVPILVHLHPANDHTPVAGGAPPGVARVTLRHVFTVDVIIADPCVVNYGETHHHVVPAGFPLSVPVNVHSFGAKFHSEPGNPNNGDFNTGRFLIQADFLRCWRQKFDAWVSNLTWCPRKSINNCAVHSWSHIKILMLHHLCEKPNSEVCWEGDLVNTHHVSVWFIQSHQFCFLTRTSKKIGPWASRWFELIPLPDSSCFLSSSIKMCHQA